MRSELGVADESFLPLVSEFDRLITKPPRSAFDWRRLGRIVDKLAERALFEKQLEIACRLFAEAVRLMQRKILMEFRDHIN